MSVTKLPVRRVPITEVQILRNRYDEAKAIKEAWDHRLRRAQREYTAALTAEARAAETKANEASAASRSIATRRNLDAIHIQVTDAAGELKVALNNWMAATLPNHERRAS